MPMIGKGTVPLDPATAAYEPSTMSTLGQFLFGNNGSWADSKAHLRDLNHQQAMMPEQDEALRNWNRAFSGGGSPPPQVQPGDVIQGGAQGDGLQPQDLPTQFGQGLDAAVGGRIRAPIVPQAQAQQPFNPLDLSDPRSRQFMAQGALAGMPGAPKSLLEIANAAQPKVIEGPRGIYREQPDHSFKLVQPYPDANPSGFRPTADGTGLEFIPNGPADPAYIARTAGVRRDAVVDRPIPQRVRAAGRAPAPPAAVQTAQTLAAIQAELRRRGKLK